MTDSFAPPAPALACGLPASLATRSKLVRNKARLALLRALTIPACLAVGTGIFITSLTEPPTANVLRVEAPAREPAVPMGFFAKLHESVTPREYSFDIDRILDEAASAISKGLRDGETDTASRSNLPAILQFGPMRVRRDLAETIVRAARDTDMDAALLMAIADKESSFVPAVRASTSSATGLFQFIDATWMRVVRDFGARHGLAQEAAIIQEAEQGYGMSALARQRILALRNDPYLSALMAAEMLKSDSARIASRIGRELSEGETYLAHFLGPGDAEKFMSKVVAEPRYAAPKLLPKPAKANKAIFYARASRKTTKGLTVADVHQKFETMMGQRWERYRDVEKVTGLTAYSDLKTP